MRHESQIGTGASYGRVGDSRNPVAHAFGPGLTRMATMKIKVTEAPAAPERGVRAATFRLLLDTAMAIIREAGHIPSVAEVAARSRVSRATAYRYFPSRSVLITAVINRSLEPVRSFKSKAGDGRERARQLFLRTSRPCMLFEPQMPAALQHSRVQWAFDRAALLGEATYRRGHRVRIREHAIEPLAAQLPKAVHGKRHRALSVIFGIEPWVVLKDI